MLQRKFVYLGLLRIVMGWMFLWAFLDKVWGFGFATEAGKAWTDGVSPTAGFLNFAVKGPFESIFKAMAGSVLVDWLFMLGLLFLGLALVFGLAVRAASYGGVLLMLLLWLAVLPPAHNPVIDEHIIYALLLLVFSHFEAGNYLGFGGAWKNLGIVKKWPFLR